MSKPFTIKEFPFAYFSNDNNTRKGTIKNLTGYQSNKLKDVFFSDMNIMKINKGLVYTVYLKSNKKYKIALQNKDDLMIVMNYIYNLKACNLPDNIEKQVNLLNKQVVDEILSDVMINAEYNMKYIEQLDKPLQPIMNPISTNRNKTLPSISGVFHN
jgi:metal-sulfur cluster biosynthetic enzyme